MTIDEFRQNPALTSRMKELMDDPVFVLALECLRYGNPPVDPPCSAPEIVSVRMLSQMQGYARGFEKLAEMGLPLIAPVELEEEFAPEIPEQ